MCQPDPRSLRSCGPQRVAVFTSGNVRTQLINALSVTGLLPLQNYTVPENDALDRAYQFPPIHTQFIQHDLCQITYLHYSVFELTHGLTLLR